jgi:hypothetical protein
LLTNLQWTLNPVHNKAERVYRLLLHHGLLLMVKHAR